MGILHFLWEKNLHNKYIWKSQRIRAKSHLAFFVEIEYHIR